MIELTGNNNSDFVVYLRVVKTKKDYFDIDLIVDWSIIDVVDKGLQYILNFME